jgi:hypothetical protein
MPEYDASLFAPPAPLAQVSLRNADTGVLLSGLPMLIDSGADVTLIPQASAVGIGAVIDSTSRYELMGFDGSVSAAQAVHLDLLFLRRAFKGRFLLTSQSCGVLGRDVLNHLAIILNGPRLVWDEANKPAS